ncbi:hypothetical protein M408DRAFT_331562 [Serendipita vermifera MAFF 305830]|uniref:Uncharacterized protein n=1 Tax=Serendipita vermifera MAFF 305830 TaxID=933852 RepID=A0A0C3AY37_SERVB|nr:hypothetical protein M408DRAFT_331562 [Serendipita vermifera MAFF 305830]
MILKRIQDKSVVVLNHTLNSRVIFRRLHQSRPYQNEREDAHKHQTNKDTDIVEISDAEWELRAGRAFALVKETLPSFFVTGLIEHASDDETTPSIYSPKIQLQYTPPPPSLPVPLPFPHTLQIDGLPLYHASSVFVRHSLSMFYTDLRLELRSCRLLPCETKSPDNIKTPTTTSATRRERKFAIGFEVLGSSRMGGGRKEWDVLSTYHISPLSGQIYRHIVESIQPAPHSSIYATLGAAFGKFAGFRSQEPEAVPGVRTSDIDAEHAKTQP